MSLHKSVMQEIKGSGTREYIDTHRYHKRVYLKLTSKYETNCAYCEVLSSEGEQGMCSSGLVCDSGCLRMDD